MNMNILRGLGGRVLGCGCLVGLYETYSTRTIAILDARDSNCSDVTHQVGASIDVESLAIQDPAAPPTIKIDRR